MLRGMAAQTKSGGQFDLQPILTGELLQLRPLQPADFDALFSAASDPLIWEQHPESDRYIREVFQRYFDTAIDSGGAFAIIDRSSGRIIGSSRYYNYDRQTNEIEIGWTFLERRFWGGRYNRELKTLMLEHAFRFVDRVLFIVGEDNLRSRKAVEKIGGTLRNRIERPHRSGRMTPNLVFVLDRETFKKVLADQNRSAPNH
jgi:RimJ/RimL family protein N-acetyltransferase